MVSVCLPSDALLQLLPSYLGFSYLGHRVFLHGCSRKAQPLLLTLDERYLLMATPPDLERGVASLSPPSPRSCCSLDVGLLLLAASNAKFPIARRRIPQRETVATLRTLHLVPVDVHVFLEIVRLNLT